GGPAPNEIKIDVTHLKRLAAARLRNVVVEHLNEWSKDGLEKTLKVREKDHHRLGVGQTSASTKQEISDLVEATAWWDYNEKAVFGPNNTKLFGSDGMTANAKLHNVNPITLAWVLYLLVKHNKAKVTVPEVKSFEEAKATRQIAWAPALEKQPPRRAGSDMTA